jgi:GNAT superfamily N-acetyltransferase
MQHTNISHGNYLITTDKSKMHLADIHEWLSTEAYWSKGVPYHIVEQAFNHSFCIGILHQGHQVGYARLMTDYAVFAYLADVYILKAHRGQGLSKLMMKTLMELDWVKGLRVIMLATQDAQGLYSQFGFTKPEHPERIMHIRRPDIYGVINS